MKYFQTLILSYNQNMSSIVLLNFPVLYNLL